ncbi:toxin VasX [uncultured Paracoccus sp.]|uniref:toxin VasX n=1 Tax=uncultured Paracoccus sp. TaxID=189685 RepID=UPI0025D300EA|nr:toxin VasX [uncultured Paracoccus sp.]
MTQINTSYDATADDGIDSLPASGEASATAAPCDRQDIIGIYPVRIAWGDLKGEVNDGFTYPSGLAPFAAPDGPARTGGFALRRLRPGNVMIFDPAASVWSMFVYTPDDTPAGGGFARYTSTPDHREWRQTDAAAPMAYVPDSATEIHICFVEHAWSLATMQRAHANTDGFRDKVMTRVTLTAPSDATYSAPLEKLAAMVEEFGPGRVQPAEDWAALSETPGRQLDPAAITGAALAKGKSVAPIMVALHDPVGVVLEMNMGHANRMALRADYLQANTYALATARASQALQKYGESQLRNRDLGFFARRNLRKWGEAIRPERDTFLVEAEATLKDFEKTIKGPLDAWAKYYGMGLADPTNTPGSLQTQMLHYDNRAEEAREIVALARFAHDCVVALTSSQEGQAHIGKVMLDEDRWNDQTNPIKKFFTLVGAGILSSVSDLQAHKASLVAASDELMRDIAMPMARQVSQLRRMDMLTEVNRFSSGIYNRTVVQVPVDIDDMMAEVRARPRTGQSTFNPRPGHTIHRIQTPTMLYKFDGTIHVAGSPGIAAMGSASAGFGIFANALNMFELTRQTGTSTLRGAAGAIGSNPYLGLTLTTIDTLNQLFALSAGVRQLAGTGGQRGFQISGSVTRAQLTALMKGKAVTNDLVRTLIDGRPNATVARVEAAPPRTMMAKVGIKILSGAGIALGFLDLFNAYEAYRRGDNIAMISSVALGTGAILMATGGFVKLTTGATGIGAVAGLILIIIGAVLSFLVDDPVTAWLRNCYWGDTDRYLFWDDRLREDIADGPGSYHEKQRRYISAGAAGNDVPRFFAREMQHFHELVYAPQNAPDPAVFDDTTRNWLGVVKPSTASRKIYEISFRLPNFVPGYSDFQGRVVAHIHGMNDVRRVAGTQQFDVSREFWANARYDREDIVTGSFEIRIPGNADSDPTNDIKWRLLKVELAKGWLYTPVPGLILPRKYNDPFFGPLFGGEWTDEGAGEGEALIISGA